MSDLVLLLPSAIQVASLLGVVLATAMFLGLAALTRTSAGLTAAAPLCGWQIAALVLTAVGVADLPLGYGFWPLAAAAAAGVLLIALRRARAAEMRDLLPLAVLGVPLLLVLAGKYPSEVDTFTHWLPNAEHLVRADRLPGGSGPPSMSFYPGFPHNLTFVSYAASRLVGVFAENASILFGGVLLLIYAALLARLLIDAWSAPGAPAQDGAVGWRVAGLAILLTIPLNPVFVRKIAFNAYPDLATSIGVAVAGILAWRTLDAFASGRERVWPLAVQLVLVLALLVNVKQANLALCLSLLGAMAVVAWRDPAVGLRRVMPWMLAALAAIVVMHGLWRLHLASGLPLKENTLLPLAEWQFANIPAILATMGKVLFQKIGYALTVLALLLVAARALVRPMGSFGRLALLVAGTFVGYTLFLLLIYVAHFQGNASTGAQSYWRFNTHIGYLAWAAALVGLAQLLRTRRHWAERAAAAFRRYGVVLPVLAAMLPLLAAGLIRYDLEKPKPLLRVVAHDLAKTLPPDVSLVGYLPWDEGSLGSILTYYLRSARPDMHVGIGRERRGLEAAIGHREGEELYLWIYCRTADAARAMADTGGGELPAAGSSLLRREGTGWQLVRTWPHDDETRMFGLAKTLDWDACAQAAAAAP